MTTRGLRQIIKDLLTEISVDKTVHGFRHYFTTTLITAYQSDLLRVANYTRHRSVETLQVYNDRLDDEADLAKFYGSFTATIS